MLSPPVSTLDSSAVSLTHSGRRLENAATSSAPAVGTSTSMVRIGKDDHRLPRTTTNQPSSSTTPTPIAAA